MSTQILTKLKKGDLDLEALFIVLTKELYFKKVCTLKRSVDAHTMVSIVAVFYADLGPYLISLDHSWNTDTSLFWPAICGLQELVSVRAFSISIRV